MDTWGFILLGVGVLLYFVVKDKRIGSCISGIGLGIVIGAAGAYLIVMSLIPK